MLKHTNIVYQKKCNYEKKSNLMEMETKLTQNMMTKKLTQNIL